MTYFLYCILSFKYSDATELYESSVKYALKSLCLNPLPHHLISLYPDAVRSVSITVF